MAPVNDAASLFNVNGMVAVITGGGSGLGVYAARALDANGAKAVYIVGRREETLQKAAATGKNGTIRPLVGDVTDPESLKKVVATIEKEEGFVNLLFANAGVLKQAHGGVLQDALGDKKEPPTIEEFSKAYLDSNPADFTDTMHVNCTGVFYSTVAFLPLLKKGTEKRNIPQDSQVIVTVSEQSSRMKLENPEIHDNAEQSVTCCIHALSLTSAPYAHSPPSPASPAASQPASPIPPPRPP
jgi:NAD(P)-dependent dehydrogenase (short-subunit alcohol dehydrogenase family)